MNLHFRPASSSLADLVETNHVRNLWQKVGDQYLKALEDITGLSFRHKAALVRCGKLPVSKSGEANRTAIWLATHRVLDDDSFSSERRSDDDLLAALTHELCHRLLAEYGIVLPASAPEFTYNDHRLLYAFLYDSWVAAFGKQKAKELAKFESAIKTSAYQRAWRWAMRLSAIRRARITAKLIRCRKTGPLRVEMNTEHLQPATMEQGPPPAEAIVDIGQPEAKTELLQEDYEQYGWILSDPDFQKVAGELDNPDFDLEQWYQLDIYGSVKSIAEKVYQQSADFTSETDAWKVVKENRFLKAAVVHAAWRGRAAAGEADLIDDPGHLDGLLEGFTDTCDDEQLAFNYRYNIEDADYVLKGIKQVDEDVAHKLKIIEQAKAALAANGDVGEYQIKNKEQLPENSDRLTNERAAEAWHLGRLMAGEADEHISETARGYLGVVSETVSREIDHIKNRLNGQGFTDDARLLEEGEARQVGMVPLERTLTKLVARYLVQSAGGLDAFLSNPDAVPMEETKQALEKAAEEYLAVYKHDIPLYDQAFSTFDAMGESAKDGKMPFEVYLGRDGAYAFVGRNAQHQAGKWELDDSRHRTRKKEQTVTITPKYLVFPRDYISNLTSDAQVAYLGQESITQEQNPHFFDTGYAGTIPEHILTVLGYDKSEIDKHIHLVSSDTPTREIEGMRAIAKASGFNLRKRVETLEHSPKDTKTSAGLYRDERGRVRPIETASSPQDQLIFQFVKQGIWRHYWAKTLQKGQSAESEQLKAA